VVWFSAKAVLNSGKQNIFSSSLGPTQKSTETIGPGELFVLGKNEHLAKNCVGVLVLYVVVFFSKLPFSYMK